MKNTVEEIEEKKDSIKNENSEQNENLEEDENIDDLLKEVDEEMNKSI